jgi:hypothetical protein
MIMKNVKVIGYGLWVIGMLLVSMPTMAQEWESTSSMQGSGSAYSSQVTAVGATSAADMGTTTTANYSPGRPGQVRKGFLDPTNPGNQSNESPIGEPWVLAIFAAAFAAVIAVRRKRSNG